MTSPATTEPAAPRFDVNAALNAVLAATRDKVRAARTVDLWRDRLDREARRRYAAEASAPAWNTPNLGKVRLDPKPAAAHVTDPDALAGYVLGISPDNVTATINLPAAQLEAALDALRFADVDVTSSTAQVRPAYLTPFLAGLVVVDDDMGSAVLRKLDDEGTAEPVPGVGVTPASATLVVTLDAALKRETLARVDHELGILHEAGSLPAVDLETSFLKEARAVGVAAEDIGKVRLNGDDHGTAAAQRAHAAAVADRLRATLAAQFPDTTVPAPAPLEDPASSIPAAVHLLASELLELTGDQLKLALKARRLSVTGRKADLARRLAEVGVTAAQLTEEPSP